jgi:hypothetical protein
MNLRDLKQALTPSVGSLKCLPPHIVAFSALMIPEYRKVMAEVLTSEIDEQDGVKHYGYTACLGFALGMGHQGENLKEKFLYEVQQLAGRSFFSTNRVARFEIDGVALLGVATGLSSLNSSEGEVKWFLNLLADSEQAMNVDNWQKSLIRAATALLTDRNWSTIPDSMIRVAIPFALKKSADSSQSLNQAAWEIAALLDGDEDVVRLSVKRAVFDYCASFLTSLPINSSSIQELIMLLSNVSGSMSHWTYETKPRVKSAPMRKWEVDHEYHVQNLLWTILKPIFSDLVDEESLPKVGHTSPRFDLGIPSLQTIIEVKYMRRSGQAACKKVTDEVAADSALYLSKGSSYRRIIAFIWDNCSQIEEYHILKSGLESLNGVESAIIISRPNRMRIQN